MRDRHAISFVSDDALADGQNFMFIGLPDGGGRIFYRESAISPKVLEDSWAAYRRLLEDDDDPDDGAREPVRPQMKALTLISRDDMATDAGRGPSTTFERYAV